MKEIFTILIVCLFVYQPHAQPANHTQTSHYIVSPDSILFSNKYPDSLLFITSEFIIPVIFDVNKYNIKTTIQLEETVDSIKKLQSNLAYVWIGGSASPEGPLKWNLKLGKYRAEALSNYIANRTGLTNRMFRINNLGEDWNSLEIAIKKDMDFPNRNQIINILSEEQESETRKRKIQELDHGKTWRWIISNIFPPLRNARLAMILYYPKLSPIDLKIIPLDPPIPPSISSLPISASIRDIPKQSNWKIAIKTNLLFDAILTANLGVEISPWVHWSFDIPVWYSPYNITSTRKIRLLAVQPEIRYWFKETMNGNFIGLHTHVVGFNIAINDHARYQDPNHALWGMGMSYGYAMSLGNSERWGLEFNIGAGFAKYRYDAYHNQNNGERFKSGANCYWGITRAGVTLSYKWNFSRKNHKN